ncbi:MAG: hypothetical protein K2X66_12165 [Cyanobacteria bacterium]|nr:hypothetical protein [Cyanobacteriota bacterium]
MISKFNVVSVSKKQSLFTILDKMDWRFSFSKCLKHLAAVFGVGLAVLNYSGGSPAFSNDNKPLSGESQKSASIENTLQMKINTRLDSKLTPMGAAFEGVLAEPYATVDGMIPQGTVLKGIVSSVKPSRRFTRPGFFILKLDEMILPTGETHQMALVDGVGTESYKITHSKAKTFKRYVKKSLPLQIAYYGVGIPLFLTTNLSNLSLLGIDTASRSLAGIVVETLSKEDPSKSLGSRIAYGAFRGTGIPGVYGFIQKDQNLEINPGQVISLRLPPETLQGMMRVQHPVQTVEKFSPDKPSTSSFSLVEPEKQESSP